MYPSVKQQHTKTIHTRPISYGIHGYYIHIAKTVVSPSSIFDTDALSKIKLFSSSSSNKSRGLPKTLKNYHHHHQHDDDNSDQSHHYDHHHRHSYIATTMSDRGPEINAVAIATTTSFKSTFDYHGSMTTTTTTTTTKTIMMMMLTLK